MFASCVSQVGTNAVTVLVPVDAEAEAKMTLYADGPDDLCLSFRVGCWSRLQRDWHC